MADTKHTQGPWSWHGVELLSATEFVLATSRGSQPRDANARLIAAAPAILECLKDARQVLDGQGALIDLGYIDEVIANAEGRS